MTDVEQLLHETLTDPRHRIDASPELFDNVRRSARKRRQRNVSAAGATTLVIAVVIASIAVNRGPAHRPTVPAAPAPSAVETLLDSTSTEVALAPYEFGATDLAVNRDSAYVLTGTAPMRLLQLDPATGKVLRSAYGPSDTNGGLVLDSDGSEIFVWSAAGELREYDAHSLVQTNIVYDMGFPTDTYVFSAVSIDGQVWFATSHGLFAVAVDGNKADTTKVAGLSDVFGLAADPDRQRVIVGTEAAGASAGSPTQIDAVDLMTKTVTPGGRLDVGKESIAVANDQIWVGGYGETGTPRLIELDANLQPTTTPAVNSALGPGAIIWAGEGVLWVRHGGDERLDCVNASTGAVLQTWANVQGPVSSIAGAAYAADNGTLRRLTLDACAG